MNARRAAIIAGAATSFVAYAYANVYRFLVTRQRVELAGLQRPVRLAQLCDLHYGPFIASGSVRRWVSAAMSEKPDVIVITGDFLQREGRSWRDRADLLRELACLHAPLGVYFVWGNHDWSGTGSQDGHTSGLEAFAQQLTEIGFRDLNNAGVQLRDDLYLAGVDDMWFGRPDLNTALAAREGGVTVLLAHHPQYLDEIPASARVDLTLCGHTHGGQICIPVLRPMRRIPALGPRYVSGWVNAPALGYVSRGLGVIGVPARLNCPAELAVMDLAPPTPPP